MNKRTWFRRPAIWLWLPAVIAAGMAFSFEQYSTSRSAGNCADCHGNFRSSPYTSLRPGEGDWPDDLHDVHRNTMLDGDCTTCHGSGGRFPTLLGTSAGGTGLPAISCAGCHGRAEDGSGSGSEGYSAGLRQHHFRVGVTSCEDCHADADPASMTPVGEDVAPPYYFTLDAAHPDKPTDACNPAPAFNEGIYGATTAGLDNDGDDVYDENDGDCRAVVAGPGETSMPGLDPLIVNARDAVAGSMTLGYGNPCEATENTIEYGPLADVAIYGYSGQECSIGTTGAYDWFYPAGDLYFLVVANNGTIEGSYGIDGAQVERPEDDVSVACPLAQDLADRCDP